MEEDKPTGEVYCSDLTNLWKAQKLYNTVMALDWHTLIPLKIASWHEKDVIFCIIYIFKRVSELIINLTNLK